MENKLTYSNMLIKIKYDKNVIKHMINALNIKSY